ncbi:MAG: hypothetical protein WCN81_00085 [Actinomycetes bacterium]
MHIVRDSDVVQFRDDAGDTLTLLSAPRQRDVQASNTLAWKLASDAMKEFGELDINEAIREAQENPEVTKQAQKAVENPLNAPPEVRRLRYRAMTVSLVSSGELIGGNSARDAYDDFDPETAKWADERVAEVWVRALPTDADTQGPAADAAVPAV